MRSEGQGGPKEAQAVRALRLPQKYKRLREGKHKFKVRVTDVAGNSGEAANDKFKVVA